MFKKWFLFCFVCVLDYFPVYRAGEWTLVFWLAGQFSATESHPQTPLLSALQPSPGHIFLPSILTWDSVLKNSVNKARCSIPQILPKGMNKSVLSSLSSNFNFLKIYLRRAGSTRKCCMLYAGVWASVYKRVETGAQTTGFLLYCSPHYFWKRQLSATAIHRLDWLPNDC